MATLLKGTAFITGAGSGIGQYTAWAFAKHGVKRLALSDINPKALRTTVDELRNRHPDVEVESLEMDVADEGSVESGLSRTVSAFGSLDIAVNNAGVGGPMKPTAEVTTDEWKRHFDINLTGVWLCERGEIQRMLKQNNRGPREGRGTIINVASMLGLVAASPTTPATAYVAGKHAVMGLTKTDAVMYAPHGIRINAMCPGYVETPLLKAATASGIMDGEIKKTPMGRLAQMEEIADAIVFLASPFSSFMCGAGLVVDGGFTVQ